MWSEKEMKEIQASLPKINEKVGVLMYSETLDQWRNDVQWMVDNLYQPHTPDHFNIPANLLQSIDWYISMANSTSPDNI